MILYKKDSKGKLRTWEQEVLQNSEGTFIVTLSGLVDGVPVRNVKVVEDSKVQEAFPRALKLVENTYVKKKRDGYTISSDEAVNAGVLLRPMLAKTYEPGMELTFPLMIQPKLNGIRCLYEAASGKMYSKKGLEFHVDHVKKAAKAFCEETGILVLDGELFIPGRKVSEILSAVKNFDNPDHSVLEFHLYDEVSDADFRDRYRLLGTGTFGKCLKRVFTCTILKREDLKRYYDQFLHDGFEGLMLRMLKVGYECGKRTFNLIKWKPVFDKEFKVVTLLSDWFIDKDRNQRRMIKFNCVTDDGVEFEVVPSWTHEERAEWYDKCGHYSPKEVEDKFGWLNVEYREMTVYNSPFHGVGKYFRPYGV